MGGRDDGRFSGSVRDEDRDVSDRIRALAVVHAGEQAIRELLRDLASSADDAEAHTMLAICSCQVENHIGIARGNLQSKATQSAIEGIRLDPECACAHYSHAQALVALRRFDEAETAIQEAIRLNPQGGTYYGYLARIYSDVERFDDALRYADHGLALDPESVEWGTAKSCALMFLFRIDEAHVAAESALRIDPENAVARTVLGETVLTREMLAPHCTIFAPLCKSTHRLNRNSELLQPVWSEGCNSRVDNVGIVLDS